MKVKKLKPRNHVAMQKQSGAGKHKDKRRRTLLVSSMREAKHALRARGYDEQTRDDVTGAIRRLKHQVNLVL